MSTWTASFQIFEGSGGGNLWVGQILSSIIRFSTWLGGSRGLCWGVEPRHIHKCSFSLSLRIVNQCIFLIHWYMIYYQTKTLRHFGGNKIFRFRISIAGWGEMTVGSYSTYIPWMWLNTNKSSKQNANQLPVVFASHLNNYILVSTFVCKCMYTVCNRSLLI